MLSYWTFDFKIIDKAVVDVLYTYSGEREFKIIILCGVNSYIVQL